MARLRDIFVDALSLIDITCLWKRSLLERVLREIAVKERVR